MNLRYLIDLIKEADEPPEYNNLVGEPKQKTRDARIDSVKLMRKRNKHLDTYSSDPNTGMHAHGKPSSNEQEFLLKSYLPIKSHEDAKYQYVKMLIDNGLINNNRYAPLIYKISSVKDPHTLKEKIQYRMQRYLPFTQVPVSGILRCFEEICYAYDIDSKESEFFISVGRNIVDSEYEYDDTSVIDNIKANKNKLTYSNKDQELEFYEKPNSYKESVMMFICQLFEETVDNIRVVVHDPELAEILDIIQKLDGEGIGNVDFHEYNVMFKHEGNNWQLVFTDPLYGNY